MLILSPRHFVRDDPLLGARKDCQEAVKRRISGESGEAAARPGGLESSDFLLLLAVASNGTCEKNPDLSGIFLFRELNMFTRAVLRGFAQRVAVSSRRSVLAATVLGAGAVVFGSVAFADEKKAAVKALAPAAAPAPSGASAKGSHFAI